MWQGLSPVQAQVYPGTFFTDREAAEPWGSLLATGKYHGYLALTSLHS